MRSWRVPACAGSTGSPSGRCPCTPAAALGVGGVGSSTLRLASYALGVGAKVVSLVAFAASLHSQLLPVQIVGARK